MHEDHLVVVGGQLEVGLKDLQLVSTVLVETDLADAEHVRPIEEVGDEIDDLPCEDRILRLLGVDAEPGVVGDAVLGGPLRFGVGQDGEVVEEALRTRSVVARPERRFGDRDTSGEGHALVVVGGPTHHVDVRIDVHQPAFPS